MDINNSINNNLNYFLSSLKTSDDADFLKKSSYIVLSSVKHLIDPLWKSADTVQRVVQTIYFGVNGEFSKAKYTANQSVKNLVGTFVTFFNALPILGNLLTCNKFQFNPDISQNKYFKILNTEKFSLAAINGGSKSGNVNDELENSEDELVNDLLDNNIPLECLSATDGVNNNLSEFIGFLPPAISKAMQEFADEKVTPGFKQRVIETLSGADGVYSKDSFKRALSLEVKKELSSLSAGAFFQRVDSLAQRVLNPDEYSGLPPSTSIARYEELNRLLKEKNDRALEALGNEVRRQIPTTPHRANDLRAWFSDPNNQQQLGAISLIDLGGKNLKVIPPEIGQLGNLLELRLSGNQITQIPPEIGQLGDLESLCLSCNQIREIPPEIGHLGNLERLNLDNNQISVIPPEIGQLVNLQQLWLSGNQITEIPAPIAQLRNLQLLGVSENQITKIPPEIGQLRNLRSLNLSNNQITQIPPEIGQLVNLQHLWLSNNQITKIPPEIGQLRNLRSLNLSNNQITQIPPEIGQLVNLQHLWLSNNQISVISKLISKIYEIGSKLW